MTYYGIFTSNEEDGIKIRSVDANSIEEARDRLFYSFVDDYGLDDDEEDLNGSLQVFEFGHGVHIGDGIMEHVGVG